MMMGEAFPVNVLLHPRIVSVVLRVGEMRLAFPRYHWPAGGALPLGTYLRREWIAAVLQAPVKREVQLDGRIRFWAYIPALV